MKICILHSSYDNSDSPFKEVDDLFDEGRHVLPHFDGHEVTTVGLDKATSVQQVSELVRKGFDVFVNLCDGSLEENRAGIEVVQTLDRLDAAYTGADPTFYDPTREEMKRVCHYNNISTPRHVAVRSTSDIEIAVGTLRFPVIAKHPHGYSSVGMTRKSRAVNPDELRLEASKLLSNFGGALIEEFIEGRELTVLVCENPDDPKKPIVFPPIEYVFPDGETFKHFDLKWRSFRGMQAIMCRDSNLCANLTRICADFFVGMRGSGYGRVDLRVDASGIPHVLEINPNCGIFYAPEDPGSADFILLGSPDGYQRFVDLILRSAFRRVKNTTRPWEVFLHEKRGYGTRARINIPAGTLIEPHEERPHLLVTRSHVERCWNEIEKCWFAAYAWPLTDEVWIKWSDDPMQWRPLNHSCNPNSWLSGLDLVARYDISAGEEITMDYATFCHESMPAFNCSCGASSCRQRVSGADILSPIVDIYGAHLSDYVRRRRIIG